MAPIFCFTCSPEKQLWLRHVAISPQRRPLAWCCSHYLGRPLCIRTSDRSEMMKGIPCSHFLTEVSPPFCRYFHFLILLATGTTGMVSQKENCGALPCSEWSCSLNWMGICIVMEFKSPLSHFLVCFGMLCAGIFLLHPNVLHGEVGKPVQERLEDRLPP